MSTKAEEINQQETTNQSIIKINKQSNIVEDDDHQESSSSSGGQILEEANRGKNRRFGLEYKTSLPVETQRALIQRVLKFGEHESFREVCNQNTTLYGTKGSGLRRKVQARRATLITLKKESPKKFEELVYSFLYRGEEPSPAQEVSSDEEGKVTTPISKNLFDPLFSSPSSSLSTNSTPYLIRSTGTPESLLVRTNKKRSPPRKAELIPIMSGKAKATGIDEQDDSSLPSYLVNIEEGEQNVNGWLFFESNAFKWVSINGALTESISTIVMVKALPDIFDIWGTSFNDKMSVSLLPDGSGVVVDEPSISSFLFTDIEQVFGSVFDGYPDDMKEAVKDAHGCAVNSIMDDKRRKRMKYRLIFPRSKVGAKGYWNRGAKGLKLTPFPFTNEETLTKDMTGASEDATFSKTCVFYLIPIDKDGRVLKVQDDEDVPIEKMFKNFARMSVANKRRNRRNNNNATPAATSAASRSTNTVLDDDNGTTIGGGGDATMHDDDDF